MPRTSGTPTVPDALAENIATATTAFQTALARPAITFQNWSQNVGLGGGAP